MRKESVCDYQKYTRSFRPVVNAFELDDEHATQEDTCFLLLEKYRESIESLFKRL